MIPESWYLLMWLGCILRGGWLGHPHGVWGTIQGAALGFGVGALLVVGGKTTEDLVFTVCDRYLTRRKRRRQARDAQGK